MFRFVAIMFLLQIPVATAFAAGERHAGRGQGAGAEGAALVKAQGDKAFTVIDDRNGPLVDRDLYITVIDRNRRHARQRLQQEPDRHQHVGRRRPGRPEIRAGVLEDRRK